MSQCPNCGLQRGLHHSILPGCLCTTASPFTYAVQQPQRTEQEAESQEPKCVVIVEVFGNDWRLEYMSLPVGKHKLYAQQYLYTRSPQRTWQGLTKEQLATTDWSADFRAGALWAEAKLKEKNT